jgi:hypothetical protein
VIGNEWTFWEYAFFGVVVFLAGLVAFVLDNWPVILTIAAVCYVAFGRSKIMKFTVIAVVLVFLVTLAGCAAMNLGSTKASYRINEGFSWDSNKNQENLKATGIINKDGTMQFSIETTAVTPESAIAAAAAAQLKLIEMLEKALAAKPMPVP